MACLPHRGFPFVCQTAGRELAHRVCVTVGIRNSRSTTGWRHCQGRHRAPCAIVVYFQYATTNYRINGVAVAGCDREVCRHQAPAAGRTYRITHWGMSGPAVLKLSALAARELADRHTVSGICQLVAIFHENNILDEIRQLRFKLAAQKMHKRNPFGLPSRLWEHILTETGILVDMRWADLPSREQNKLANSYVPLNMRFPVNQHSGGVCTCRRHQSLDEVDASTMQSRKHPGLLLCRGDTGCDGPTGGFNFQNAWTTAWIAARSSGKDIFNESVDRSNL